MSYYIFFLVIILMMVIFFQYFVGIENKTFKKIDVISSLIILSIFFYGIQETTDKNGYKTLFENLKIAPDIGFILISKITFLLNGDYQVMIFIYYTLMIIFILKYLEKKSSFMVFVILNLQIYTMVYQANQIRYFLSFYIFLYSITQYNDGKKLKAVVSLVCGVIFHKAIILLYPFLFLQKYPLKKYLKYLVILNISIYFSFNIIKFMTQNISAFAHYKAYLVENFKMGISGWIFIQAFYFVWIVYILFIHNKIVNKTNISKEYLDIFKLVLYPIAFNLLGSKFLEINLRYILSFQVVILVYVTYVLKYFNPKSRVIILVTTVILSVSNYFYFYELPILLGKESQKKENILIYKTHKLTGN